MLPKTVRTLDYVRVITNIITLKAAKWLLGLHFATVERIYCSCTTINYYFYFLSTSMYLEKVFFGVYQKTQGEKTSSSRKMDQELKDFFPKNSGHQDSFNGICSIYSSNKMTMADGTATFILQGLPYRDSIDVLIFQPKVVHFQ